MNNQINLPVFSIPTEYEDIIMNVINKTNDKFNSAIDFLNSNVISIIETNTEIIVKFKSILSNFNYFMMMEIVKYNYLGNDNKEIFKSISPYNVDEESFDVIFYNIKN